MLNLNIKILIDSPQNWPWRICRHRQIEIGVDAPDGGSAIAGQWTRRTQSCWVREVAVNDRSNTRRKHKMQKKLNLSCIGDTFNGVNALEDGLRRP